ncbi:hypothetical protein CA54_35690 [Symmachiella macrocystis]|uniref:Uncharacterized protein n=1 Tax=Symmachiella macrocystis TaxID=2527985 RepID=A0A5C6BR71_9PLAN|nr:hypothetical protein CA54_35690 [Symmachiella macrocystis]
MFPRLKPQPILKRRLNKRVSVFYSTNVQPAEPIAPRAVFVKFVLMFKRLCPQFPAHPVAGQPPFSYF